jgi:hypothetical protein
MAIALVVSVPKTMLLLIALCDLEHYRNMLSASTEHI